MSLRNFFAYIFFILISLNVACTRYVDSTKRGDKLPKDVGYLTIYPDSNVFTYKTNVVLTRDNEKIYPKSFKIDLPKGLKYYEVVGSSDFVFYYDNQQVVMIKIDLTNSKFISKRSYVPTYYEVENIIQSKMVFEKSKYDIRTMLWKDKNKQLVVEEKGVMFLLYNIRPEKYNLFVNSLKSFAWYQ